MNVLRSFAASCAAVLSMVSTESLARPITFGFTGTVNQSPLLDPTDPFSGAIGPGTAFSGTYVFESSASDDVPADPSVGSYLSLGIPYGIDVDFGADSGGFSLSTDTIQIATADNLSGMDQYSIFAEGFIIDGPGGAVSADGIYAISLFFEDLQGEIFSNDSLPLTPPDFRRFDFSRLSFEGAINGNQVQIEGTITSLRAIPEPGIGLLMGIGLILIFLRRRSYPLRSLARFR